MQNLFGNAKYTQRLPFVLITFPTMAMQNMFVRWHNTSKGFLSDGEHSYQWQCHICSHSNARPYALSFICIARNFFLETTIKANSYLEKKPTRKKNLVHDGTRILPIQNNN